MLENEADPTTVTIHDSAFFKYVLQDTSDLERLFLLLNVSNRKRRHRVAYGLSFARNTPTLLKSLKCGLRPLPSPIVVEQTHKASAGPSLLGSCLLLFPANSLRRSPMYSLCNIFFLPSIFVCVSNITL